MMTTTTRRDERRQQLGPAVLVGVTLVAACLAVVAGVAYAVMALTGGAGAEAPVRLTAPIGYSEGLLPCVQGWSADGSSCEPAVSPDEWPGGEPLPVRRTGVLVASLPQDLDGPTEPLTALLATATHWGGLVAGGAVGIVLVPVLRATASGRPFAGRNDRRLGLASVVVVAGWLLGTAGDWFASHRVVAALEATPRWSATGTFDLPVGWISPALQVAWWPLLLALLLAALAAATRRGARLAADTEGLV